MKWFRALLDSVVMSAMLSSARDLGLRLLVAAAPAEVLLLRDRELEQLSAQARRLPVLRPVAVLPVLRPVAPRYGAPLWPGPGRSPGTAQRQRRRDARRLRGGPR